MKIGTREFNTRENTYIMGILNVTPDSFSDGGKYQGVDKALKRAEEMIAEGADILDIGGESTRPGYTKISEEEEMERILPIIEAIKARFDIPISVDTYKSKVADMAIKAGADLVNDIWGLKADPHMAEVIMKHKVACCLMHNRKQLQYENFLEDILFDLKESIQIAKDAGIENNKIILDIGVGFAKTYEQNLLAIKNLEQLHVLGYPVLLGTSRKSVIGLTLNLPSEERIEGTLVTTVLAVQKGCGFVRVHDIKENYRAIQMTKAILNI
ncbi:MAG: dihydropteroate synthase [Lachnospiraceae bacterium]|nr:dihydropteroate synthase [Lachnospiraceae bacterium]